LPRAYHTANFATLSGVKCVVIVGGVSFKGQSIPSERLPINEPLILKVHDTLKHEYSVDKITATVSVDTFVSYHSVVSLNDKMYITGGFVQTRKEMNDAHTTSNKLYTLDLQSMEIESKEWDTSYCTAGNTSFALSNDCIMVVGGSAETFFAYTTKPLRPSPCDLHSECLIFESPETSPIAWVQCEGNCKQWLHQYCVGLLEKGVPRGKCICTSCKGKGRKRKSKT